MIGGLPVNYYLFTIHSRTYIYNSLALHVYASHFIYTYRVFENTSNVCVCVKPASSPRGVSES